MSREPTKDARYYLSLIVGIPLLIALIPIIIPVIVVGLIYGYFRDLALAWRFRRRFLPEGKIGVFVYSDSPNWKEHVETHILPRVTERFVILNWSRRAEWVNRRPLEVRVFQRWAGSRSFNPIAIIVRRFGTVDTIRFFDAFRAHKHGKSDELRRAEQRLFEIVEAA